MEFWGVVSCEDYSMPYLNSDKASCIQWLNKNGYIQSPSHGADFWKSYVDGAKDPIVKLVHYQETE